MDSSTRNKFHFDPLPVENEALTSGQLDLFQESWNEDVAAVAEEVEQLTPTANQPKRVCAGRYSLQRSKI